MLVGGGRSQGLVLTCLIGVAGALGGGWAAYKLFHIHTLHGFFNLDAWLTAIAGAAVLLLVYHLATGRSGTCSLLTASAAVICCCAGPVAAMGKKSSGSWPRQAPSNIQPKEPVPDLGSSDIAPPPVANAMARGKWPPATPVRLAPRRAVPQVTCLVGA